MFNLHVYLNACSNGDALVYVIGTPCEVQVPVTGLWGRRKSTEPEELVDVFVSGLGRANTREHTQQSMVPRNTTPAHKPPTITRILPGSPWSYRHVSRCMFSSDVRYVVHLTDCGSPAIPTHTCVYRHTVLLGFQWSGVEKVSIPNV